ncbi:hypothetical protein L1887_63560 [Cichorium endivia]|nr:hypothetical protein L1887_63560 [Cichorium endivia]
MLTLEPFSEDQGRSAVHPARGIPPISFLAPCGFTHPLTRSHMSDSLVRVSRRAEWGAHRPVPGSTQVYRRDGACCPTTIDATASPRAYRQLGLWPPHQSAPVHAPSRSADRLSPFHIRPGTHRRPPIRFPPDNFKHSLTLFSKGLGPGPPLRTLLQTTIRTARPSDFQAGLIPVRSPLLRESLASLTAHDTRHNTRVFSTTTSRASTEGDSSLGQPHHKHGRPISAPMPCVPIRDAWLRGDDAMRDAQAGVPLGRMALGATCVQKLDGSRDSAIHTKYMFTGRSALQGSTMILPAGSPTGNLVTTLLLPLNDKVQWNSRDVAGGEPPTSPRS